MKKVLITYHSQTGNTGKIAKAISKELEFHCTIDMKSIEECVDINLNDYELVFIGSPIIAAALAEPVKKFINTLQNSAAYAVAGFITHSANRKEDYIKGIELLRHTCDEKKLAYAGCFDCVGYMNPEIHDFIKEKKGFSDKEWEEKRVLMKGHPNSDDVQQAKKFARDVLNSL
ncbi:MAG: hypothetical protein GY754_05520 [bacterium]|nr:hypothetical protein [bacterium]